MANMNINITGLDTIAQAINNLAQALGKGGVTASFSESTARSQRRWLGTIRTQDRQLRGHSSQVFLELLQDSQA